MILIILLLMFNKYLQIIAIILNTVQVILNAVNLRIVVYFFMVDILKYHDTKYFILTPC